MSPIRIQTFGIRQFLQILFSAALILAVLSYLVFQARNLINGPEIALREEPAPLQHTQTVLLEGSAQNITSLTLNGNPIFTDEEGNFTKKLVLENGYTIMTLHATDRFGRETSLARSFVYTPEDTIN